MSGRDPQAGTVHRTAAEDTGPPSLVYVIEDDPGVARLVLSALQEFGFNCEAFGNGAAALRRLQVESPTCASSTWACPTWTASTSCGASPPRRTRAC